MTSIQGIVRAVAEMFAAATERIEAHNEAIRRRRRIRTLYAEFDPAELPPSLPAHAPDEPDGGRE